jgi:hypothetical protein
MTLTPFLLRAAVLIASFAPAFSHLDSESPTGAHAPYQLAGAYNTPRSTNSHLFTQITDQKIPSSDSFIVTIGEVSFRVPRKSLFPSPEALEHNPNSFSLSLVLPNLGDPAIYDDQSVFIEISRNATALSGEELYEDFRRFSEPSIPITDALGYKVYANRGGELVDKQFNDVHFFAECSKTNPLLKPPAVCGRTIRFSKTLILNYTFNRKLLGVADLLDAAVLELVKGFVIPL